MRVLACLLALFAGPLLAQDQAPRAPLKEPVYVGQPLYCLFELAPEGKGRTWAVLDRSKKDLAYHDVLYFDLDGDGDLCDENEKFTTTWNEKGAKAGVAVSLRIPRIAVPGTELVHTDLLISTVRKPGRKGIWFRMKWQGKTEVSGGYGDFGSDVTIWREKPEDAPIIRPNPQGVLSFATWGDDDVSISIARRGHVNVIIGHPGRGPDSLAIVDENFIDLEKEALYVTIIGRDAAGKEVRQRTRITEHC